MRTWQNAKPDNGAIHCLGNGLLCVYEQGPDVVQIFGPPYSAPAVYQFLLDMEVRVQVDSEREPGTAIWHHQVILDGKPTAKITDFVVGQLPCLVRKLQLNEPLQFRLKLNEPIRVFPNKANLQACDGALLLEVPAGRYFFHVYPFPTVIYHQIAWRGSIEVIPAGEGSYIFKCEPGESNLFFSGGPDYPEAITSMEKALSTPYASLLQETHKAWGEFTRYQVDAGAILPESLPQRHQLIQTIDDVSVMIKAQQSIGGGILAGYNYHMAFVRDQYGTARGLIALGHVAEARAVLEFYWRIWQHYGVLHNGQAVRIDGVFHIHENDEVELTGYLILQAFDLLAATQDDAFIERILPMLEWAWRSQLKHLVNGMLPFNGDETYIAGGILPRSTINDGSAEATLLFLSGGKKLLDWVENHQAWKSECIVEGRQILSSAQNNFRRNFLVDGRLVANNPSRVAVAELPRFRHGVCEKCQEDPRLWYIGWTERSSTGRYLCPKCLAEAPFPAAVPTPYRLNSTGLVPFYLQTDFLTSEELRPMVEEILRSYNSNGQLSTRQDVSGIDQGSYAVGYDFGFLLNALSALKHPQAQDVYLQTMAMLDPTGSWVEYYRDNQPKGTRCRPWESAINLEAILKWATTEIRNS